MKQYYSPTASGIAGNVPAEFAGVLNQIPAEPALYGQLPERDRRVLGARAHAFNEGRNEHWESLALPNNLLDPPDTEPSDPPPAPEPAAVTCSECGVVLNSEDLENLASQEEDWSDDDEEMPVMCESCWFGDED